MPPTTPLQVLVIEDDPDTANSLKMLLQCGGYSARVARDGIEGLRLARESHPEVILCDIAMPRMDGHAVARALRSEPELAGTRLIAMTGSGLDDDVDRCLRAGFDDHLLKPVDWHRMRRAIDRLG